MGSVALVAPDGREFDVPEENAEAAMAAGWKPAGAPQEAAPAVEAAPAAPAPAMVPMRAPDGREFEVPETNLQAALEAGWETNTSFGQKVRTAFEGGARGLSLGISDAAQTVGAGLGTALGNALADDVGPGAVERVAGPGMDAPVVAREGQIYDSAAARDTLHDIRLRQETDRGVAIASEVAGAVLPALFTGGSSSLASAARLTPAGAANLLAARVQAEFTKKLGSSALGRIGALAVAGGAEQATQSSVRRIVDDLVEGDHEISAERMLNGFVGVLEDASLGALTGGVLGTAVEGSAQAYRLGRGLLAKAAPKAAEVVPPMAFDLTQGPAAAAENAGPLVSSQLPTVADNAGSPIVQAARGAVQDLDDLHQGAVRAVASDMDDIMRSANSVDERAGLAAKRQFADQLQEADPDVLLGAFQKAHNTLEEVELSARSMVDEFGEAALQDRGGLAVLKRLETAARATGKQMVHRLENGDFGDAYMALDDFKRIVGEAQNSKNPLIQARVRSLYDRVRVMLEDEGSWGVMAAKQKPVNAGITEKIRRSKDDLVRRFFRTSGDAAADPFEQLTQSNSEGIGALLGRLGDAEVEPAEQALRLYLRSVAVDAETRAAAWGTPELLEEAKRITGAVSRVENRMNAVAFARRDAKAWKKIVEYAPGTAGGVLRGAAKAGQAAMSWPARLAESALKEQRAVEKAAGATLKSLTGAGSPKTLKAAITVANMQRAVSRARALQDPSSSESARLRQGSLEVAHDDPAFAQALEAKQRAAAAFLAAKAGPEMDDGDPLNPRPAPMDPISAGKLIRYADAYEEPGRALERIAHGQGSAEDIEVMQQVYPRLLGAYVKLVEEQLARGGVALTPAQRTRLNRATGLVVAREQRPDNLIFLQRVANQKPADEQPEGPPARGKGRTIDPDKHYGPRSDQLMESRG